MSKYTNRFKRQMSALKHRYTIRHLMRAEVAVVSFSICTIGAICYYLIATEDGTPNFPPERPIKWADYGNGKSASVAPTSELADSIGFLADSIGFWADSIGFFLPSPPEFRTHYYSLST